MKFLDLVLSCECEAKRHCGETPITGRPRPGRLSASERGPCRSEASGAETRVTWPDPSMPPPGRSLRRGARAGRGFRVPGPVPPGGCGLCPVPSTACGVWSIWAAWSRLSPHCLRGRWAGRRWLEGLTEEPQQRTPQAAEEEPPAPTCGASESVTAVFSADLLPGDHGPLRQEEHAPGGVLPARAQVREPWRARPGGAGRVVSGTPGRGLGSRLCAFAGVCVACGRRGTGREGSSACDWGERDPPRASRARHGRKPEQQLLCQGFLCSSPTLPMMRCTLKGRPSRWAKEGKKDSQECMQ